jgi:uncharacterized delta-60 repeat protein
MKKQFLTAVASALSLLAVGQAGELDLAFNGDGIFTQSFNTDARAQCMALQADGKVLIGGRLENNNNNDDLLLMRLDNFGNPDLAFGIQGYTSVDFRGDDEVVKAIQVAQNGTIITLAESDTLNRTGALFTRFFSNGQVDQSFGNQGHLFVYAPPGSTSNDWHDMRMMPDGSLLAVGRVNGNNGLNGGILKITPQGQRDQSFGTNGLMEIDNNGSNVNLIDIETVSNGDFFVLGSTTLQGNLAIYIAKFNSAGSLVTNFGGNGIIILGLDGAPFPKHLIIKPDGKLFITAQAYINGWSNIVTIQLNANGLLDQGYGINGRSNTQILSGGTNASASAYLPDGKMMLTGHADGPWNDDFALARLQSDGSLDLSFHFDGYVTKNIGGGNDYVVDAALQTNGRIVLVGNSANQSDWDISVARFLTGYSSAVDLPENLPFSANVYPNPSNEWLKIEIDKRYQEIEVRLFTIQGEEIMKRHMNQSEQLDMSAIPNGLYILAIQTSSGQVSTQKISVLH